MKDLETIKSELAQEINFIQSEYKIKELGIFGSYARNEQKENSDLDILIDYVPNFSPSLIKFLSLENYLSDKLGIKVDLVMKNGLRKELKPYILGDIEFI